MTRIQKIREDIFQIQCLDRESSLLSVDDYEWTLRQLELMRDTLDELCRAVRTPDVEIDALLLERADALLQGLRNELPAPAS